MAEEVGGSVDAVPARDFGPGGVPQPVNLASFVSDACLLAQRLEADAGAPGAKSENPRVWIGIGGPNGPKRVQNGICSGYVANPTALAVHATEETFSLVDLPPG